MFAYTDPGKTLKPARALANYQLALHLEYSQSARLLNSGFTLLEAFEEVEDSKKAVGTVEWSAFPRAANATNQDIDTRRFRFQDEYVEWAVLKTSGRVARVTFTTDFLAYYEAIARVGSQQLIAAIRAVIPGAQPNVSELFGPGFDAATASEDARGTRFRSFAQQNPWINGQQGILCLAHGSSSAAALFRLVDVAGQPNTDVPPSDICQTLGGNCVPERNSDPSIAAAVQTIVRNNRSYSLADPVGIEISRLTGVWRLNGQIIDVNDTEQNQGIWTVSRSGRRGVLNIPEGLVLDDTPISTGAQVASVLRVKASVVSASNPDLPEWARLGSESSQRLSDLIDDTGD